MPWRLLAPLSSIVIIASVACSLLPFGGPQRPEAAVHVFLWGNAATTERDLRLAKEAGFTWVKQRFEWRNIERDGKGRFEWDEPDRIVKAAEAAGLKILARLDGHAPWTRAVGIYPDDGPPDKMSDWADFVSAVASRYKGRIAAYEVWNEPNLAREWGGKPPDPAEYVALLKVSQTAIKRADDKALVITAGLSPTTATGAGALPDLEFLKGLYAAGGKGNFDLLGVHGAGFKSPPDADPGKVALDPALTNNDPSPVELRRAYAFRRVEDLRQAMVDAGDAERKIAVLEMGWTSDSRPNSPYRWHSVSEAEKADYLSRAFQYARSNWSWAYLMTVIYLPDPAWTADQEQTYWSITNRDGTPRDAYTALKRVLRP